MNLLLSLLSPVTGLLLAPMFLGLIYRARAFFGGRKGQPLLQPYYDLAKLLDKSAVYSTSIGMVFKTAPLVCLSAPVMALLFLPLPGLESAVSFSGDFLIFAGLFAIMRFFTVAAALETGSAFEGMGASREIFFSALAEPVLLVALAGLARESHSLSLSCFFNLRESHALVPHILLGAALVIIMLAENSRIPVDDPSTHLELTMIHEAMILDHSGPDLAFIEYGASIKLWLFSLLFARTILPQSGSIAIDFLAGLAAMASCAILIGTTESAMARLRLPRVPQLLVAALAFAIMGFVVSGYAG